MTKATSLGIAEADPEKQAQRVKGTGRRADRDYAGGDCCTGRGGIVSEIIHGAPQETAGSPV
jgi:hypothetical protein